MDPFAKKMLHASLAFAAVMLVMFATLSVVYLHMRPPCSEQVVADAVSPDQRWTATVMERRCGGNSIFLTHVNLRPSAGGIQLGYFSGRAQEGEVFVVEQDAQSSGVTALWVSPRKLVIKCPGCAGAGQEKIIPRKSDARWLDVEISYELD